MPSEIRAQLARKRGITDVEEPLHLGNGYSAGVEALVHGNAGAEVGEEAAGDTGKSRLRHF